MENNHGSHQPPRLSRIRWPWNAGRRAWRTLAQDLGFSTAFAGESAASSAFGPYESLVELIRSTPPEKLQPILIAKLKAGEVDNKQLIAAAALANAEAFGGRTTSASTRRWRCCPLWK